jgi:hypothetical protein
MAKKKKPAAKPAVLNQRSYLASGRARQLPVYKCSINQDWAESGLAHIYVLRKHANGHITAGIYLVDIFCVGVKDTFCFFNVSETEFNEHVSHYPFEREACTYTLAHNIIYGALAFAAEYGIAPHLDFNLTRYILEEDTEAVPLMELEFGRDGKPFLVLTPNPRNAYFLRQLEKNAGPGNYDIVDNVLSDLADDFDEEDDDFDDFPNEWNQEDWEDFIEAVPPGDLKNYPAVAAYMYTKTVAIPAEAAPVVEEALHPRPFGISEDPLPDIVFEQTPEEQQEIKEIHAILYGGEKDPSEANLSKITERLKKNTGRWPQNPIFYLYLADAQFWANQPQAAMDTTRELYARFPDYLPAKLKYGHLLVEERKLEEVLPLLEGKYHLAALAPQRETFHISELVDYYMLMSAYFLEKNQLYLANMYALLLDDLNIPPGIPLNYLLFIRLNEAVTAAMKPVLKKARQSEADTQALIHLLLQ